jgi:heterotetrameric sarcosine oxidase delta subunit
LRDQNEFQFGGAANVARPADPSEVSDAQWADYLFYRDNPKGPHLERWVHSYGCRQWFTVERDTVTHEITGAYEMGMVPGARQEKPSDG